LKALSKWNQVEIPDKETMALPVKRIIINADDLGLSRQVNEAVKVLMSSGVVTSATIMANGPCWSEAVDLARSMPDRSFGVHLNLTEGHPLTGSHSLEPLVDDEGNFRKLDHYHHLSPAVMKAVLRELCAQVERLNSSGIRISHLDSHQHIHTQPRFFGILKRIQSLFRIRKVRISKNIYRPFQVLRSPLLRHQKALWNFALRSFYRTQTTAGFTDFRTFMEVAQHHGLPHSSLEIMAHPGNEKHAEETALLASWKPRELPFSVRLINYHEL
jgi:chitin disaccharide deacetylase